MRWEFAEKTQRSRNKHPRKCLIISENERKCVGFNAGSIMNKSELDILIADINGTVG